MSEGNNDKTAMLMGKTPTSRAYTLSTFKRREGLTQKEINALEKRGILQIQQGGFHGHSSRHRKIVVVLDPSRVKRGTPGSSGYTNRVDRRRRTKERLLNAPSIDSDNFSPLEDHGKDHHVQFRISPFAEKVGSEVAALFNMSLSQYCKAILYLNLGLTGESVDRRRRPADKRRRRK